jgi:hypothetical protein
MFALLLMGGGYFTKSFSLMVIDTLVCMVMSDVVMR